jgi:hypothetical protein
MRLNGTPVSIQNSRYRTVWTTLPLGVQQERIDPVEMLLMKPTIRSPAGP